MCGISGVVFDPAYDPQGHLHIGRTMTERLRHRGPDAQGVMGLPKGRGVFAHTRLKVIDLSENAAQPFASEDRAQVLVFNGEIYNFAALAAELKTAGVSFRSSSDTEVILRLYQRYGADGLRRLDGMFAIALWDQRTEQLLLMRDRFGKKPLYWTRLPSGAVVFASEAKALFAHPQVPKELEPSHIPQYLLYGYVQTPRSIYRNIHRVPPSSMMTFQAHGAPRTQRYWSLDQDLQSPRKMTIEEAKSAVRQAVGEAVERRLVSDVPLGAFLSGGIDSSIIVAEMARRSSKKVRTFAVGFSDDRTYDETPYAQKIADLFCTEHMKINVSFSPVDVLESLLYHHDEPYGDSSALAVHAVSKATRDHVTVVLTGDGGDELFAGYTRFRGGMLAGVLPPAISGLTHSVIERIPEPRGYKNPLSLFRRFVEHGRRSADEQLLAWNSHFVGATLKNLLRPEVFGADFDPWAPLAEQVQMLQLERSLGRDRLDQILRHNLQTYLLDDLLVKTDRMTMAVSLEARSPFLDTALAQLAFSLPSWQKLRYGQLKWLLREAYRDLIPADILDRQKHGFGVPLSAWFSGALRPMLADTLLASDAKVGQFLRLEAVRSFVDEHLSGQRDHGQAIFTLLQLELWLRHHA